MNVEYVLWNLREAAEELTRTIQEIERDPNFGQPELLVAMTHLYHHLNTAWNARHATAEQAATCTQQDFDRWRQFPRDILLA